MKGVFGIHWMAGLAVAWLACAPAQAAQDGGADQGKGSGKDGLFQLLENQPRQEWWLNAGFYAYHFQRDKRLNDRNPGLGVEYRFSSVASVTAGRFYNSDRDYSNYAGLYYQPFVIGPVRLGAVAGGFNGYPNMRRGGWFLAAIPVASIEYRRVGLNVSVVPSYKDRLYGALTLQLKFKLAD